jgi:hypothetical protein
MATEAAARAGIGWEALGKALGPQCAAYRGAGEAHRCDACHEAKASGRRDRRTEYPQVYTDATRTVDERALVEGQWALRARAYQRCSRCWREHEAKKEG